MDLPYSHHLKYQASIFRASHVALVVKNPPSNERDVRDLDSIPGLGKFPGGGHDNPLQYSCLEDAIAEEPGGLQSTGLQRVGHS